MLAILIFGITLTLVIWQPRKLGIGWSAMGGAGVALATGVIKLHDIPKVWHIVWDATFTFVALIIISLILDEAGFFKWAALHIARWGKGRGKILFPLIILLGAAISAIFANDGAALLLTPIMMAILLRLEFPPAASLAFIIGTGFVADTTSLPLMISNLVNIVSANYFGFTFNQYALTMIPVDIIALIATLAVLLLFYGRDINVGYHLDQIEEPASAIVDQQIFHAAWPILIGLMIAYLITGQFGIPVSFVTCTGAAILLVIAGRWTQKQHRPVIDIRKIMLNAPWQIVIFSVGMYLVVYGLRDAGYTNYDTQALTWLSHQGNMIAAIGAGFLAAILSSVMNNLPATLVGALAIGNVSHISQATRDILVYANVIGCDLGPKFTPIGSLATLLWLHVLAGKGTKITWGQYIKVGLVITPPVLLITLAGLAIWLPFIQ
jgi:arsenical pump membrane protein